MNVQECGCLRGLPVVATAGFSFAGEHSDDGGGSTGVPEEQGQRTRRPERGECNPSEVLISWNRRARRETRATRVSKASKVSKGSRERSKGDKETREIPAYGPPGHRRHRRVTSAAAAASSSTARLTSSHR